MLKGLPVDLSWQSTDINIWLPIILSLITFVIYWFTAKSEKVKAWFYQGRENDEATLLHISFNRIVGFVSMGVLPLVVCLIFLPDYSLADYGLTFARETNLFSLFWIVVLGILVVPMAMISARKPENLVNYPQIRAKVWTRRTAIINIATWALYLFGYEMLFRGVLLIPLAGYAGVWIAISVNIAMYAATHIPKGLTETIGAIPLGLVLCLLTLASGTIWIAFLVHLAMALTNSFTALKHNPEMSYNNNIK